MCLFLSLSYVHMSPGLKLWHPAHPCCHHSGIWQSLRWESELKVCCTVSCSSALMQNTFPTSRMFSHLPFLSVPSPSLPQDSTPYPSSKVLHFRLLILTWLLFVKPVIGRSQSLLHSFSGKWVPAACWAAASMNPRASQLDALVSLSSPLCLPEILCWVHMGLGM